MQSNAIQEDIQSKDFDKARHVFEPKDRNKELVALLQPHISFPVETHNVMDGVQSLIDQIALLRCDLAAAQKKQEELKRVIENDDVPKHKFAAAVNDRVEVWRENVKLWCEGHISHVNSDGTYHVFYSNGFSDTQVVENLIKRRVDVATVYDHLIEEATKLLARKVESDSDYNRSLIANTFKWDNSPPRTVLPVLEPTTAANRNSTESRPFASANPATTTTCRATNLMNIDKCTDAASFEAAIYRAALAPTPLDRSRITTRTLSSDPAENQVFKVNDFVDVWDQYTQAWQEATVSFVYSYGSFYNVLYEDDSTLFHVHGSRMELVHDCSNRCCYYSCYHYGYIHNYL